MTLTCGCDATVRWRIPLIFVYRISIDQQDTSCARHHPGSHSFVGLERMKSGPAQDRSIYFD
ncbi:MAG: hypothetical protein ACRD3C_14725 [Vicinamibacterales bacterium]